jgi:hypothetical protein
MRQSIFFVAFIFVSALLFTTTTGCMQMGAGGDDSLTTDSVGDTINTDTLSQILDQQPMPIAADELFDDFFFNYAASKKVQVERTTFPLEVEKFGEKSKIGKKQWRHDHFFMSQGYYTLIFNNEKQLKLVKDTSIANVTVEKIDMPKGRVTRWHFQRDRGLWHMNKITTISSKQHQDAAFLEFYNKFASDSAFQQKSLAETVTFTGPDPDDDFSTMTGEIMPEQWPVFAPSMPSGVLYNIHYGAKPYQQSNVRYFLIRGIANGLQTDILFIRKGNQWLLKKVTT